MKEAQEIQQVKMDVEVTAKKSGNDIIIVTLKLPLEKIKEATEDVRSSTRACI